MKIPATILPLTGAHDHMVRRTTHDTPFLPICFMDDKGISALIAFVTDKLEAFLFHSHLFFLPAELLAQPLATRPHL